MSSKDAATMDKRYFENERPEDLKVVGTTVPRADALEHVTGQTKFFEDVTFHDMLHLKMVRSTKHHALIKNLDVAPALEVEGVIKVLTHEDVAHNWFTILRLIGVEPNDEPVLAEDRVLFKGEQICAVLAETAAAALEGASKVIVEYEDLEPVFDVEEALKSETKAIKPHGKNYFVYEGHHCRRVRLGDIEKGFAESDFIVEECYQAAPIEHAPVETTGCIVKPEGNGRFTVYSNTQALFFTLDNACLIMGLEFGKMRIVGGTVGGGFGGKVDVMVEPIATIAAMQTGRPIKYVYSREEEMQVSSPRAAERIYIKSGVLNDGRINAAKITIFVDAGAYSRHSPYGTTKAAAHMPGPYTIPNVWVDAHCVYTNRTPSSAMRGFGVTIGDFALESQMDRIAEKLNMHPLKFRMLNAYRDGEMKAHRKLVEGAALVEVIQAASDQIGLELGDEYKAMTSLSREA